MAKKGWEKEYTLIPSRFQLGTDLVLYGRISPLLFSLAFLALSSPFLKANGRKRKKNKKIWERFDWSSQVLGKKSAGACPVLIGTGCYQVVPSRSHPVCGDPGYWGNPRCT